MSPAVVAVLNGTPEPYDLRCREAAGRMVVTIGAVVLFCYERSDLGSRNIAIATLRSMGFAGQLVAAVFGLGETQVATVRSRALREGPAGVVRRSGRAPKLSQQQLAQAVAWHKGGLSNVEIGRRLGVHNSTVSRVLSGVKAPVEEGEVAGQEGLDLTPAADSASSDMGAPDVTAADVEPSNGRPSTVDFGGGVGRPVNDAPSARIPASAAAATAAAGRIGVGTFFSRYAGAMLLHAFTDRVGAGDVFASAATSQPGLRFDDLAVLTATSTVFALGFASLEQAKHPDRAQVGPVAGIAVLPELRTLRPRLAGIADGCDPLELQRAFATAMLAADPALPGCTSSTSTSCPTPARSRSGRAGTPNAATPSPAGSTPPSATRTAGRCASPAANRPAWPSPCPPRWTSCAQILGPDAPIMLGFDRGGAYPDVFTACRNAGAHWITYRRGPLAAPTGCPSHTTITHPGAAQPIHRRLRRRDRHHQRLRPGPPDHPVRARQAGAADPHLRHHRPAPAR